MIPAYMPMTPGAAGALGNIGINPQLASQIGGYGTQGLQKGAQFLGGAGAQKLAGRYMPVLGGVAELATTGDVVSAGGSVAGGIGGAKLGALLGTPLGPLGVGAGALIGSIAGGEAGKKIAKGGQNVIAGALGMGSNQLERAGIIGPYGTQPGLTPQMIRNYEQLASVGNQMALNTNAGYLQQADRFRDNELNRSMRAMNQVGQIQAGLGGMKIAGQLADRQLAEAGGNFRGMISAQNPYANVSTGASVSI